MLGGTGRVSDGSSDYDAKFWAEADLKRDSRRCWNYGNSTTRCYTLEPGLSYHSVPRLTKDLDVLVAIDASNSRVLFDTLKEFEAPIHLVNREQFEKPDFLF